MPLYNVAVVILIVQLSPAVVTMMHMLIISRPELHESTFDIITGTLIFLKPFSPSICIWIKDVWDPYTHDRVKNMVRLTK